MGGHKVGAGAPRGKPIAGYAGFVTGVKAEGLFAKNFATTCSEASMLPLHGHHTNPKFDETSHLRDASSGLPPSDKAPYPENLRDPSHRIAKYGGFMPGVTAENLYSHTSSDIQDLIPVMNKLPSIINPDKTIANQWWAPTEKTAPGGAGVKVGYGGFVPHIYSQNIHGSTFEVAQDKAATVEHVEDMQQTATMRSVGDVSMESRPFPEDHSEDKHLPGYGGFVPGLYARNVFGATFEQSQRQSEVADALTESMRSSPRRESQIAEAMRKPAPRPRQDNPVKISGYSGFVANIASKNVCGSSWATAQQNARQLPDHTMRIRPRTEAATLSDNVTKPSPRPRRGAVQKLPGYAGYVPKIYARNVYAGTFEVCQTEANLSR